MSDEKNILERIAEFQAMAVQLEKDLQESALIRGMKEFQKWARSEEGVKTLKALKNLSEMGMGPPGP